MSSYYINEKASNTSTCAFVVSAFGVDQRSHEMTTKSHYPSPSVRSQRIVQPLRNPQRRQQQHGYRKDTYHHRRFEVATTITTKLRSNGNDYDEDIDNDNRILTANLLLQGRRPIVFSLLMTTCGAILGPFLDSFHSAFGVLQYDNPITATLWSSILSSSSSSMTMTTSPPPPPALITTWWVPELFGLAGFIIGWLYILLDHALLLKGNDDIKINTSVNRNTDTTSAPPHPTAATTSKIDALNPSPPKILLGISYFTFQYWFSGLLVSYGIDRTTILNIMSVLAAGGFVALDGTLSGFWTSLATCVGGPLIEVGLLTASRQGWLGDSGYHYTDLGETGFFPLWIVPVYFLGGPANGNLARGFWNWLVPSSMSDVATTTPSSDISSKAVDESLPPCPVCNDTRRVICPNCDGVGTYVAMGDRTVTCTSCRGKGYVMCRACFDRYDEDPYDIEQIRQVMDRMPD